MWGIVTVVVGVRLVFVALGSVRYALRVTKSQLWLFLLKALHLCSFAKLSCESQTSRARLVKVRIIVALCDVGL